MKKNSIIVLSLIISILGIIALFFLKPEVSPQYLQINGTVKNVYTKGKVTFISFIPDDFLVVSFDKVDLTVGNHTLVGRLQQYKGRVEFIVEDYD